MAVLAYRTPSTGDGQEALVIPFIVFWTLLAVGLIWLLDWMIRAVRATSPVATPPAGQCSGMTPSGPPYWRACRETTGVAGWSRSRAESSPDRATSLLPLTGLDEAEHARASRNAEDALRDTRAAEPQWQEHGFGPWAIRDKRDDSFLGCAELRFAGEGIEGIAADEVEAGWWVTEERRNEGIATEAMEAAIDDLWSRTDVQTITAYIEDGQNEPSRRVAAKLGFAVRSTGRGRSGEPMTAYTLCRDDWLRRL